ncbi:hypothetical protein AVEN_255995-1 [Araneus ventricosus]|uniref:ATP-dependent DNA helicase n=1 Tax=Araneus ventricosus TaxID=182803 RepID=A0A4Y2KWT3_ARAVE|nr:hypothetical protein AVEN_255995-1 [Araneus ventricosus]
MKHSEEGRSSKYIQVTQLQFYAYRLAVRSDFSILHHSGKLFQQYIVDAYSKSERSRLNYSPNNKKTLRIEHYEGLLNALNSRALNQGDRTGKLIILPSAFQGSPRHMHQNYQDAMAMVRKFSRCDLFVTFTCNLIWVDILNVLEGKQHPEARLDIVVRVFKMKLTELLDDIIKRNLFGRVVSYIYEVEFKKRGLPHAHILLTLDTYSKIHTKDDIDKYVSTELPDPIADPTLFQIITRCMIHSPCVNLNPKSLCMKEGLSTKQYPKEFREKTEENINGYPTYQRKCTESVRDGRHYLDNRWVVHYNPWLSKKFSAHINVEVCASIKSVKYLYKCVYKGHDAASIRFENENALDHDEILSFLDGRYVSAPEAMWRLNEFNLLEKYHTVVRLAVYLPDQQAILYQDGQEEEAVARAATRQTTLTAWFELNKNDQDSPNYLYTDISHYYTFNKSAIKCQKRQNGGEQVILRMPVVNIQDSERYYLRLLLLRKLGAIRLFFASIYGFGEVKGIPKLWFRYKDVISEDFVRQYSEDSGPKYALAEIEDFLKYYNLNLEKLKLPTVHLPYALSNLPSSDILEEQQKRQINVRKLNEEQKLVFDFILKTIYDNKEDSSRLSFLDGHAGTVKTFLYNTLLHTIRDKGHHVTPVASTDIDETLINGGRTAYSVFKIPTVLNATSTCNVKSNSQEAKLICDTKLLIWDEAAWRMFTPLLRLTDFCKILKIVLCHLV